MVWIEPVSGEKNKINNRVHSSYLITNKGLLVIISFANQAAELICAYVQLVSYACGHDGYEVY